MVITLPADVASETVQISYFLRGPFGGLGSYIRQQAGLHSYQVPTAVEGKPADEVRAIVYASGCDIQTFAIALSTHSETEAQFTCKHIKTATLAGQIVPHDLVLGRNAELVVNYMAYWAHEFYEISDGAVTTFAVARVSPDITGAFSVDLPGFSDDEIVSPARQAGFWLILRDSNTWNPIALNLQTDQQELQLEQGTLRIQSHYPDSLKFTATR